MSWSDWSSIAKTALNSAQKRLDKVLEVDVSNEDVSGVERPVSQQLQDDFFTAFGLNSTAVAKVQTKLNESGLGSVLGVPSRTTIGHDGETGTESMLEPIGEVLSSTSMSTPFRPANIPDAPRMGWSSEELFTASPSNDMVFPPGTSTNDSFMTASAWSDAKVSNIGGMLDDVMTESDSTLALEASHGGIGGDVTEVSNIVDALVDSVSDIVQSPLTSMSGSYVKIDTDNISERTSVSRSSRRRSANGMSVVLGRRGSLVQQTSPQSSGSDGLSSDIEVLSMRPTECDTESVRSAISNASANEFRGRTASAMAPVSSGAPPDKRHRCISSNQENLSVQESTEYRLQHLLARKEEQLVELSEENALLVDENRRLKNSSAQQSDASQYQKRSLASNQELAALREESAALRRELTAVKQQLADKDVRISTLTTEGENMSKQELKHTTIIKKLKEKEKDQAKQIENQKQRLDEIDELRKRLKELEKDCDSSDDVLRSARLRIQQQEESLTRLNNDLEDCTAKNVALKTTVEKCYKEIAEHFRAVTLKDGEIERLKAEIVAVRNEDQQSVLLKDKQDLQRQQHGFQQQVEDLRLQLVRQSDDQERRENTLREEIAMLQRRLQDQSERSEDLNESAQEATKPLLRQIESLQASHQQQQNNWERLEKSLYDRIAESERQASSAVANEHRAAQTELDMKLRMERMEAEVKTVKRECEKAQTERSQLTEKLAASVQRANELESHSHTERMNHNRAMADMERDREALQSQLDIEKSQARTKAETQLKDLRLTMEEKDKRIASLHEELLLASRAAVGPSTSHPTGEDANEYVTAEHGDSFFEDDSFSVSDSGAYLSSAGSNVTAMLEHVNERLRHRERELAGMKDELRSARHSKAALVDRLTSAQARIDEATDAAAVSLEREAAFKDLENAHQALLVMFGQKSEENEELKLDMLDLKELCSAQAEEFARQKSELVSQQQNSTLP